MRAGPDKAGPFFISAQYAQEIFTTQETPEILDLSIVL
jgi:hypothetical protein